MRASAGGDQATGATTVTVLTNSVTVDTPLFAPSVPDEGESVVASATFTVDLLGGARSCTVDYGEGDGPQAGTVVGTTCTGPNHIYDDNGSHTVTIEVCDGSNCDDASNVLNVSNANPTVSSVVAVPATINETSSTEVTATFSDAGVLDTHTCTIDWDDGSNAETGTVDQNAGTCTGSHTYPDDKTSNTASDDYTVTVTIIDNDLGSGANTTTVTVHNVPPVITDVTNNGPVAEGSPATITVTANELAAPADDPLMYEFDCDNDAIYEVGPKTTNFTTCTFGNRGRLHVGVRVQDDDLGMATDTTIVQVTNVAPTIIGMTAVAGYDQRDRIVNSSRSISPMTALATRTPVRSTGVMVHRHEPGVVDQNAGTCTGTHTYADNNPSGTPSDSYTITATIDDGIDSDTDTVMITVHNVPPVIDSITTNAPVPQGEPVNVTVTASDVAGVNDPLTYEFDCDGDNIYEVGPQAANSTSCTLALSNAQTTIGVRVTDDDAGVASSAIEVGQSVMLCASPWTGSVHGVGQAGCVPGMISLEVPGPVPTTFCISNYTGALRYAANNSCTSAERPHLLLGDGPLSYCQSRYTNQLRVPRTPGQCSVYEIPGVIPG